MTSTWLTEAQALAASGAYVRVMSEFLAWLAPQIDTLKDSGAVWELFNKKRDYYIEGLRGSGAHAQTPGALADVYIGFVMFMRFAKDVGAVDKERAHQLTDICDKVLITIGSYQGSFIRSEDPTAQFINLISALLSSGRGHLCDATTNEAPVIVHNPRTLGWDFVQSLWIHKGPCIGWIDGSTIYLEPTVAYAEAQKLARDQGAGIPFSEGTLYKRMNEQGLVYADADGKHIAKKKKINGKYKRTLWTDAFRIEGSDDGPEEVCE